MLVCVLLTGCATHTTTSLVLQEVARERAGTPPAYVEVTPEEAARGIVVTRAGRRIPVTVPMELQPGDEVRVEPFYLATITFPGGHEATLMPDTRLRLGSILELVGRVFVTARGYFKVETEYVAAGVKGTEFWVRVTPDQVASAGVISGSITVASRVGRWDPVEVMRDEIVTMRRDQPPTKELKQRAELDAIWQTMRRLRTLPPRPRSPVPRPIK
jgi:hypothetical protein